MSAKKRPHRDVQVHGKQLDDIDVDLMVQIVIMLGQQLAHESLTEQSEPSEDPHRMEK